MPQLRLTVRSITPLLMYGAANKDDRRINPSLRAEPELRASSVRGLLRYWLRTVLGSTFKATSLVYEAESSILGSTDMGSRIKVRIQPSLNLKASESQTVLPQQTKGYTLAHKAFVPESEFRIVLSTHPLDYSGVLSEDGDLVKALFLMLHFSGLGRRARRGSGNLYISEAKGFEGQLPLAIVPQNRAELTEYLAAVSRHVSPSANTIGRNPNFPIFAWDTAVVLVGSETHDTYKDAFQELWSLSGPYHQKKGVFGSVQPRRASAIHMRVAAVREGYIAQQTILYSGNGQWSTMREYIERCLAQGFDDVYGDWRHWR